MTQIGLLGAPEIRRRDGSTVAPRGAKAWALLAYLVLTETAPPRERVARLLFPDAADPGATLRWNLAELRRTLGDDAELTGDPIRLEFAGDTSVDLLTLLHGGWVEGSSLPNLDRELLAGINLNGSPAFTLWLDGERRRIHKLCASVLRDGARAAAARGNGVLAIDLAQRLVAAEPYDEASHALLIRTIAQTDGPVAASAALAGATAFLQRELEEAPSTVLSSVLEHQIGGPTTGTGATAVHALLEAGRAAVAAGVGQVGIESLGRAVVAARTLNDRHLLATALLEVGSALVHAARGTDAEGAGALHEAAAIAVDIDAPAIAATSNRELGYIEMLRANTERSRWWLEQARGFAGDDDREQAWIDVVDSLSLCDVAEYADARTAAERAVAAARRAGDDHAEIFALSSLGRLSLLRGELADARDALEESTEGTQRIGWRSFTPWPRALLAEAVLADGDLDGAASLFELAFLSSQQLADPCWESLSARGLGLVASQRGDHALAFELLEDAPRRCRRLPDTYLWVEAYAREALASAAVEIGSPAATLWVDEAVDFAALHGLRELHLRGLRHQASLGVPGAGDAADAMAGGIDNPALV